MKKCLFLHGFIFCCCAISWSQSTSKKHVVVLSVEVHFNTIARVSCDSFVTSFNNMLSVNDYWNCDSMIFLDNYLKSIKYARKNKSIDVRRKYLVMEDSVQKLTICSNGIDLLINGRRIRRNKKLLAFLNSMVPVYDYNKYLR